MALAAVPAAQASDARLTRIVDRAVPGVASALDAAAAGSPERLQLAYDRARDLDEALRTAGPASPRCRPLASWASRFAVQSVAAAEGLDRLDPARARRARTAARTARTRLTAARAACVPATAEAAPAVPALVDPRPGTASFGDVVAAVPNGTDRAVLVVDGAEVGAMALGGGRARARLSGRVGRHSLEARFSRGGLEIGRARSSAVWLLPDTAAAPVVDATLDHALQRDVRAAVAGFSGVSAVWVHDLATGRAASWNAGARFPAASTVKLGVMVAAARGTGPRPDASALAHDLAAIGEWSSNLATNRLLRRTGSAAAQQALARMGAMASTFPGGYLVGTERPPVDAPVPPPRTSRRVTTAADLGAVMVALHGAAAGDVRALRATGLTLRQARFVLGRLLDSEQVGDNRGLFRDALGPSVPAAQKQGWISSARHSAAVVYTPRGPLVVVVLTSRRGISRPQAARLGTVILRAAGVAATRTQARRR